MKNKIKFKDANSMAIAIITITVMLTASAYEISTSIQRSINSSIRHSTIVENNEQHVVSGGSDVKGFNGTVDGFK